MGDDHHPSGIVPLAVGTGTTGGADGWWPSDGGGGGAVWLGDGAKVGPV